MCVCIKTLVYLCVEDSAGFFQAAFIFPVALFSAIHKTRLNKNSHLTCPWLPPHSSSIQYNLCRCMVGHKLRWLTASLLPMSLLQKQTKHRWKLSRFNCQFIRPHLHSQPLLDPRCHILHSTRIVSCTLFLQTEKKVTIFLCVMFLYFIIYVYGWGAQVSLCLCFRSRVWGDYWYS